MTYVKNSPRTNLVLGHSPSQTFIIQEILLQSQSIIEVLIWLGISWAFRKAPNKSKHNDGDERTVVVDQRQSNSPTFPTPPITSSLY
jgi:hypothetical protein